ncbi:MAG: hypothetical protein U0Q55_07990 [Vicinamibacterales bacterium]
MHLIEVNVQGAGITSTTLEGSLCLFRPVYDKPSATTFGMSSAINTFQRGKLFRKVYCVEQFNSAGDLVKFHIQLKDESERLLGQWDLDLNHGFHTHPVVGGIKGKAHIPFEGGLADVGLEIASMINAAV